MNISERMMLGYNARFGWKRTAWVYEAPITFKSMLPFLVGGIIPAMISSRAFGLFKK